MSAAEDYPEIRRLVDGLGAFRVEDVEQEAEMILAELDIVRARVKLLEAELAATQVALRMAGNGSASYEQIREHLAGWTIDNGGRDTCAKCNLGRCPGLTGGRDQFGDRCPCVHPNGHDGACQCKHQMSGATR